MLEKGHKAIKLKITGRVQGVWYRGWTVGEATSLGLDGWVRNVADGSVEALVVGEEAKVEELVRRCHTGPTAARVDNIVISEAMGITPKGFVQKPTVDYAESRN